jgi:hypothetical protein
VTSRVSVLTLQHAVLRRRVFSDGNITRFPESHYLDLVVDERSVSELPLGGHADMVTSLNRAWLPTVPEAIQELLGQRTAEGLAEGRAALLVCGTCGDLACGALTLALHVAADTITWSDFAWENGYESPTRIDGVPEGLAFDRQRYAAAFIDAYDRTAEFPYDELAHHGRKFLWPWQWGWRLPKD